ncbi:MAG: phosphogluconate dehydrogenase C-terminal domain-containing protein [Anaerolineae bacterium]
MTTIALFGAGGKMGCRISDNLKGDSAYCVLYVEPGANGQERLHQRGLTTTPATEAAAAADAIVLAVPDNLVGKVASEQAVPVAKSGALVICLDPAAPFAGVLPARRDISYFVTHPCHPPVLEEEDDPEVRADYFGGVRARQNIVCALMQGSEEDYATGVEIARRMFAPVMRAHRITVEQMALLEPALTETVAATCLTIVREAMDEAVRRGVPAEAARDFLLGHIRINLAMFFGVIDTPLSDGAKLAVERAKQQLFRPDWKQVFEPEALQRSIEAITGARK